jgi:hypothetical protein
VCTYVIIAPLSPPPPRCVLSFLPHLFDKPNNLVISSPYFLKTYVYIYNILHSFSDRSTLLETLSSWVCVCPPLLLFSPCIYIITLKARLVCFSSTACASVCNPICRNEKITKKKWWKRLWFSFLLPRDEFLKSSILDTSGRRIYIRKSCCGQFFNDIWLSHHNNTAEIYTERKETIVLGASPAIL